MRRIGLVVAAMIAAGCGGTSGGDAIEAFPAVEGLYRVTSLGVECEQAVSRGGLPEGSAFVRYTCAWERVSLARVNACSLLLVFERESAEAAWVDAPIVHAWTCP